MTRAQSVITSMVLVSGVVNTFGAVKKGKDITYPIVGGFVVLVLLLALEEAEPKVAEMFAGAYTITCLLTNGMDVFTGISDAITSGKRFDPGPAGSSPAGTAPTASYSTSTATPPTATAAPRTYNV